MVCSSGGTERDDEKRWSVVIFSRRWAFDFPNDWTRTLTDESRAAKSTAPVTTVKHAKTFSPTVSGPTHGVFMKIVTDQYIAERYCCSNGESLSIGRPGTRSSHEQPWRGVSLNSVGMSAHTRSCERCSATPSAHHAQANQLTTRRKAAIEWTMRKALAAPSLSNFLRTRPRRSRRKSFTMPSALSAALLSSSADAVHPSPPQNWPPTTISKGKTARRSTANHEAMYFFAITLRSSTSSLTPL